MPEGATPQIKPIQEKIYENKQSKYKHLAKSGKLPAIGCILAPTTGGKTTLIANLILDVYRGAFERIYVWSPTSKKGLDGTWDAVRKYVYGEMGTPEEEECFFQDFDGAQVQEIIDKQEKIVMHLKKQGSKKIFNIAFFFDDWADRPEVFKGKHGQVLQTLAVSGRHRYISSWFSTQAYRLLHNTIRKNAMYNYVFRLRNSADLEAWLEENACAYDKKTVLKIYKHAVDFEPYSFLYCDLRADPQQMFMRKFEAFIIPQVNHGPQ